jgi:hypothetical protein
MNAGRDVERLIATWLLEESPGRAPDRILERAGQTIDRTKQRRLGAAWREPMTIGTRGFAAVAAVLVLALIGAAWIVRSAANVGAPSPPPSATTTATPIAAPLQVGTYVGPTFQVTDLIAQLNADLDLTAAERTQFIDVLAGIRGKTTWSASIELRGGQWTQRQTVDGNTQIGSIARYSFPDDHTVVLVETINGVESSSRYALTVNGDSFTLQSLTSPTAALDKFVVRILYESGPFTLAH